MAQPAQMRPPAKLADKQAEPKTDQELVQAFTEVLRQYQPHVGERQRDMLGEQFQVHLDRPLPDYNSATALAYAASNLDEPDTELIALVCRQDALPRHKAISLLKGVKPPSMVTIYAAGPVQLSQPDEERFVIFHEKPRGAKLSALLANAKGPLNHNFVSERILTPIIESINHLSELGISHGRINADNIYYAEVAVLGECVSEPCGYSQPYYYEPLDRMQCTQGGKGEGDTSHDYYALGVLTLCLMFSSQHFKNIPQEILIRRMLREGPYNALTNQEEMPSNFYDYFRGILNLNNQDRWDYEYLKPWLEGRRYNVLPPPSPMEASRPLEYNEMQLFSRREAAYLMQRDWEKLQTYLQGSKIAHWLAVTLHRKELSEQVARLVKGVLETAIKNEVQINEQLTRMFMLLDPNGPIRVKHLAFQIDGIDTLYAQLFMADARADLVYIAKFIELSMGNLWLEMQQEEHEEYEAPKPITQLITRLDRIRTYARNTGMGFGFERILYDLNPEMPCLSPICNNLYINNLVTLLKRLDQMALKMSKEDDPIDRHIAAFIASRIGMQHEMSQLPSAVNNRAMLALRILAMAHQRISNASFPGLTHWLAIRILPTIEALHSTTLRKQLKLVLMQQARGGDLVRMAETLMKADYTNADAQGFAKAWQAYNHNNTLLEQHRQEVGLEQLTQRIGHAIAKCIAYSLFLYSLLYMFQEARL